MKIQIIKKKYYVLVEFFKLYIFGIKLFFIAIFSLYIKMYFSKHLILLFSKIFVYLAVKKFAIKLYI